MVLGVGAGMQLLFLFVVLPFLVGTAVVFVVNRSSEAVPEEMKTSYLLLHGEPARGTLEKWRSPAQSFVDRNPMVTFRMVLEGGGGSPVFITQSVPRAMLRDLKPGMTFDVRLAPDRTAGAIVFAEQED